MKAWKQTFVFALIFFMGLTMAVSCDCGDDDDDDESGDDDNDDSTGGLLRAWAIGSGYFYKTEDWDKDDPEKFDQNTVFLQQEQESGFTDQTKKLLSAIPNAFWIGNVELVDTKTGYLILDYHVIDKDYDGLLHLVKYDDGEWSIIGSFTEGYSVSGNDNISILPSGNGWIANGEHGLVHLEDGSLIEIPLEEIDDRLRSIKSVETIEEETLFFGGYGKDQEKGNYFSAIFKYEDGEFSTEYTADWYCEEECFCNIPYIRSNEGILWSYVEGHLVLSSQDGIWNEIALPTIEESWLWLNNTWFFSDGTGWLIGRSHDAMTLIFKYDGSSWDEYDLSSIDLSDCLYSIVDDISMTGKDSGLIVGSCGWTQEEHGWGAGCAMSWNGIQWTRLDDPFLLDFYDDYVGWHWGLKTVSSVQ